MYVLHIRHGQITSQSCRASNPQSFFTTAQPSGLNQICQKLKQRSQDEKGPQQLLQVRSADGNQPDLNKIFRNFEVWQKRERLGLPGILTARQINYRKGRFQEMFGGKGAKRAV